MNKINYDVQMQNLINSLNGAKPKLLLHACCAPCASSCVERLKENFSVTLFFYNPNMDTQAEYDKRAKEIIKLAEYFGVDYLIEDYDKQSFYGAVAGFEKEKEGGSRCQKCFGLRLGKTAKTCANLNYEYFATTLTVSPLKNAEMINQTGQDLASENQTKYLVSDFKKRNGYLRSIELSNNLNIYRQSYCGCEFSKIQKQIL